VEEAVDDAPHIDLGLSAEVRWAVIALHAE
jgi:hypothetical protein